MIRNSAQHSGFVIGKTTPSSINERDRRCVRYHMDIALVITLGLLLLLMWLTPAMIDRGGPDLVTFDFPLNMEQIPITRQGVRRPPPMPTKPAVPIPVENEPEMEDETIEFYDVNFADLPPLPEGFGLSGTQVSISPRLIREVIPAIPENIKRRGVRGEVEMSVLVSETGRVKDVQILRNTTPAEMYFRSRRVSKAEERKIIEALSQIERFLQETNGSEPLTAAVDEPIRAILVEYGVVDATTVATIIRQNWASSLLIAKAAVDAAYKCVYIPARKGKKAVEHRTLRKLVIDYSRN